MGFTLLSPNFAKGVNDSPDVSRSDGDIDGGPRPHPSTYMSNPKMTSAYLTNKLYLWTAVSSKEFGNALYENAVALSTEAYSDVIKQGGSCPEVLSKFLRLSSNINYNASTMFDVAMKKKIPIYGDAMDAIVSQLNRKYR